MKRSSAAPKSLRLRWIGAGRFAASANARLLRSGAGWLGAVAVLAFSQLLAAVVALVLFIARRASRRNSLAIGAIISLLGALMLLGAR